MAAVLTRTLLVSMWVSECVAHYALPLCNTWPFASMPARALSGVDGALSSNATLFSTATAFWMSQDLNYSSLSGSAPVSIAWPSNDLTVLASRARVGNTSLSLPIALDGSSNTSMVLLPSASGAPILSPLLPGPDGSLTLTLEGASVAVAGTVSGPAATATAMAGAGAGAGGGYVPVPLTWPVEAGNLTSWLGGPASTAFMPVWAALLAGPALAAAAASGAAASSSSLAYPWPWPGRTVLAGLDLDLSVVKPAGQGGGAVPDRGGLNSSTLDAACAKHGLGGAGVAGDAGAAAGSLVLGGLHPGYADSRHAVGGNGTAAGSSSSVRSGSTPAPTPIPVVWSERVALLPPTVITGSATPAPGQSFTGYSAAFPAYRPSLCGVDLSPALGDTSHWLVEVDTGSACTVLPAPLFDAAARWLPLLNCPVTVGGVNEAVGAVGSGSTDKTCSGSAPCGYSPLDSLVCDVHPNASAAYTSGVLGLPVLSFWLSEPSPAWAWSNGSTSSGNALPASPPRLIQLPLSDLLVPREAVRGPQGLADPVPGLPPGQYPTHTLCLVRARGTDNGEDGGGGSDPITAPAANRVRLGTLALTSLYLAWELGVPAVVPTGPPVNATNSSSTNSGSSGSGRNATLTWADLTSSPMRPLRVGLAVKAGVRARLGLDTGTPAPGQGVYAQCAAPVAPTCKGAQLYSPLLNACMGPPCGAYSFQTYDPTTGVCAMPAATAGMAVAAFTAASALAVYLYTARWLAGAAAVRAVQAKEGARGSGTSSSRRGLGGRRAGLGIGGRNGGRGPVEGSLFEDLARASAGAAAATAAGLGAGHGMYGQGAPNSPSFPAQLPLQPDPASGQAAFALLQHRAATEASDGAEAGGGGGRGGRGGVRRRAQVAGAGGRRGSADSTDGRGAVGASSGWAAAAPSFLRQEGHGAVDEDDAADHDASTAPPPFSVWLGRAYPSLALVSSYVAAAGSGGHTRQDGVRRRGVDGEDEEEEDRDGEEEE